MISSHVARSVPTSRTPGRAWGAKSGLLSRNPSQSRIFRGRRTSPRARPQSTSQRACSLRIVMLNETAPSEVAPFRRWTSRTMSARSLVARSSVQPWNLVPITGNGVHRQEALPPLGPCRCRERIVAVASGQARSECTPADRGRDEDVERPVDRGPVGRGELRRSAHGRRKSRRHCGNDDGDPERDAHRSTLAKINSRLRRSTSVPRAPRARRPAAPSTIPSTIASVSPPPDATSPPARRRPRTVR